MIMVSTYGDVNLKMLRIEPIPLEDNDSGYYFEWLLFRMAII